MFKKILIPQFIAYIAVKKLRKSVNICQSYHKNKRVSFFMAHSVDFKKIPWVKPPDPCLQGLGRERRESKGIKWFLPLKERE